MIGHWTHGFPNDPAISYNLSITLSLFRLFGGSLKGTEKAGIFMGVKSTYARSCGLVYSHPMRGKKRRPQFTIWVAVGS
jgi:hypothetical protein